MMFNPLNTISFFVFISYSRSDSKFVDRLEANLKAEGFHVWVDRSKIEGGEVWEDRIQEAIEQCTVLVLVLSPKAIASQYVKMEYRHALRCGRVVIPLDYRPVDRVPMDLPDLHWINFRSSYQQGLRELLITLNHLKNGASTGRQYQEHERFSQPSPSTSAFGPQAHSDGSTSSERQGNQFVPPPTEMNATPSSRKSRIGVWILTTFAILCVVGLSILCSVAALNLPHSNSGNSGNSLNTIPTSAAGLVATYQTIQHSVDLTAYASAIANKANPYAPDTGSLVIDDPLTQSAIWNASSSNGGSCQFTDRKYYIKILRAKKPFECMAMNTDFSNIAFEAHMTFVRGDCGGLIFRSGDTVSQFYAFKVCQDGSYDLSLYTDGTAAHAKVLRDYSSSIINRGTNQANTIAIVANGKKIDLYINAELVDSVTDDAYSHGQIGLFAEDVTSPTEMVFSTARVWKL